MLIQSEIPADAETVFDSIIKVVGIAGYSVKKTDRSTHTVHVRVPMNFQSYGAKLTFTVEALDGRRSMLRVDAKRAVFTNLTSHPDQIARQIIGYVEKECSGASSGASSGAAWIQDYRAQRSISIREVVSKSTTLLVQRPALVLLALPFGLILASISGAEVALLGQPTSASLLAIQGVTSATISILESVVSGVLVALVIAPYPLIVQGLLRGGGFSISESLRRTLHRFWALLPVGILVGLVVGIVIIIPPILVLLVLLLLYPMLWYMYTIPAMMLKNTGVWKGMQASKAFGGNRKSSSLGLYLALVVPGAVIFVVSSLLSGVSPLLGQVAVSLLDIPVLAWFGIALSYTYLIYGPSVSVPMPTMEEGSSSGHSSSNRFCANCGASLTPEARFCANCGKKV